MKSIISKTILSLCIFGMFSCANGQCVSPLEFSSLTFKPGISLIDVRTPQEYAEGHLAGAVNIDWQAQGFIEKIQEQIGEGGDLAVYCRSGRRSAAAAQALKEQGYKVTDLDGGYQAWSDAGFPSTKYQVERFFTFQGDPVDITLIYHGSLEVRYKGESIQIDPISSMGGKTTDYATDFPKASVILITHEHGDHLDKNAINAISSENTRIIMNARSQSQSGMGESMSNGQSTVLFQNITLRAVPAYNTTARREQYHPKGNGNGYVLEFPGLKIYIAGDTEDIPELASLTNIDVAFLPVNQPYTMTVEQCVRAARTISPKVLIPYHFSQTDLSTLPAQLPGIQVRLRDMQ